MKKLILLSWMIIMAVVTVNADEWRLWPEQKRPTGLVTYLTHYHPFGDHAGSESMMRAEADVMLVQSIAGLAARAVNDGRLDEVVYIEEAHNEHYGLWRKMLLKREAIEDRGKFDAWELVARYRNRGVYDGYILYSRDDSAGPNHTLRAGSDLSVNVATSLSGILKGLLVSENQEQMAKAAGLNCILDVRGKTEEWAFEQYCDKLNNKGLLLEDPRLPFGRGTAIANGFFVMYGLKKPIEDVMAWMAKPGLVFGWNDGKYELENVKLVSEWGHLMSASDWEFNLSLLSIGSSSEVSKKVHSMAKDKDAPTAGPAVAFCASDGDNLQWLLRDFMKNPYYWASKDNGRFPFCWGVPLVDLLETGVDIYQYMQETQPEKTEIFLMPEYFYPDYYGQRLPVEERSALLKKVGRRCERALKATGVRVVGLLVQNLDSPATLEALSLMAGEMPSIDGFLVWPYHPYEGGNGKVIWVRGVDGDIPAVSCKYNIWAKMNGSRSGTPAKVARVINDDARGAGEGLNSWAIVHVWSGFKENPGVDEQAENADFQAQGTDAGVGPAGWCVDRLDPSVQLITPTELMRRVRVQGRVKEQ